MFLLNHPLLLQQHGMHNIQGIESLLECIRSMVASHPFSNFFLWGVQQDNDTVFCVMAALRAVPPLFSCTSCCAMSLQALKASTFCNAQQDNDTGRFEGRSSTVLMY